MKKLAVFGGLVAALCLLATNACNVFGHSPNSPSEKPVIEPDSTRGDTTYYSYTLRAGVTSYLNPVRFATFPMDSADLVKIGIRGASSGTYWFMRGHCEAWLGSWWEPVNPEFLVVTVPDGDGKTMADVVDDATAIIQSAGGEVREGQYKRQSGSYAHLVGVAIVGDNRFIPGEVNVLGFLSALDADPNVIASARPAFICPTGRPMR